MLKSAANTKSNGDWWIKVDSCDLTSGLMESVDGKWKGDIDLNDGELQALYQDYQDKQKVCASLGLEEPRSISSIQFQIEYVRKEILRPDMEFISNGKCLKMYYPESHVLL